MWNESSVDFEKRLSGHKAGIQNILQSMAGIEKELKNNKDARDAATANEVEQIRTQVN